MVLIIANPIVVGFVGWVGQQSLLLAFMCTTAGWFALVGDSDASYATPPVVMSAVLGSAIALTSALFLPLGFVVGAYAWLAPRWSYASIRVSLKGHFGFQRGVMVASRSQLGFPA
jgi:hypothetical protein